MGILAYTYGTNGIPLPKDKPYLVSLIDEKRMIEDIQKTRSAGADVVVIALHFGTEYEPNPNKEQIRLARKLVKPEPTSFLARTRMCFSLMSA